VADGSNEQKHKIFIVEDDVDLAEMLSAYFRAQGYVVANAMRGEDAVEAINADVPDVAVLDIRLPDIDGYEVCRRLRRSRRTQNIPVIFLTEKRDREDKLAGLELGAVDYITKPFDIQELRLRVRNSLRRSRLSTMLNPVTGLPEGMLVRERLEQIASQADWGIVLAGIHGLDKFRDRYGFVAADDVLRAVTLMITNAVQESGGGNDFVGHTDNGDFVVVTSSERCKKVAERCLVRLQPSIQYFYPALERQRLHELPESERLNVRVSNLSSREHQFKGMEVLFASLQERVA
jgi:PleD family two-component response regulator